MAEQDQSSEQSQTGFDQEAFLARMNESIQSSLAAYKPPQADPEVVSQPQVEPDETQQFLNPYIQPVVNQANFAAASAIDYTKFYGKNRVVADGEEDITEGTISTSMEKEIEDTFDKMARSGKPATREEIRNYLLGRDLTKDPKAFTEKQAKKRQQAVNRAQQGSDIAGMSQVTQMTPDQLYGMPQEQLTKSLENITF
jgi:hypothetical protein